MKYPNDFIDKIICGDCLETMKMISDNVIDTIITDPPYGLEFMGKDWDKGIPGIIFWKEMLRIAKPGAILLSFGGTRTYHRLACAVEDAGWIIKDCIMWIYGSGFPKSHDISKGIDKRRMFFDPDKFAQILKNKRNKLGFSLSYMDKKVCGGTTNYSWFEGRSAGTRLPQRNEYIKIKEILKFGNELDRTFEEAERKIIGKMKAPAKPKKGTFNCSLDESKAVITQPETPEAQLWNGWGTALKPAYEPIIVAMKPLEGTYANNALKHGIAGLNIDGSRIRTDDSLKGGQYSGKTRQEANCYGEHKNLNPEQYKQSQGRWPANVILSHHPECMQIGMKKIKQKSGSVSGNEPSHPGDENTVCYGEYKREGFEAYKDKDGFETVESWNCHPECPVRLLDEQSGTLKSGKLSPKNKTKATTGWSGGSQADRIKNTFEPDSGGASRFFYCAKASRSERNAGFKKNHHPTVKPLKLLEYLCMLTKTPTGGIVLDPFMGSGTTALACQNTGRHFIGIEIDPAYCEIAESRIRQGIL